MSRKRCLKTVKTGCISASANASMGTGEVPWNGLLAIRAFLAAEPLTLSLGAGTALNEGFLARLGVELVATDAEPQAGDGLL